MCLNIDPLWISVLVTLILGVITSFYLRETRRISLESRRPSLGLEPYLYTGHSFHRLLLRNTGGLARNLRIDASYRETSSKMYAPSLSRNSAITIDLPLIPPFERAEGAIVVAVAYQDDDDKNLKVTLRVDFDMLKKEGREPVYQSDTLMGIREAIGRLKR